MQTQVIEVTTGSEERIHNLTRECEAFLRTAAAGGDGLLHVWVPHATAGLAVIETGAGTEADLLAALAGLLPKEAPWRHAHGHPGHGRDHVMPAIVPPYATIPVLGGRMTLGTWQSLVLVDLNLNNPQREVRLSFLAG
jgi:secondary thiamine-phosphate synthase enzyme